MLSTLVETRKNSMLKPNSEIQLVKNIPEHQPLIGPMGIRFVVSPPQALDSLAIIYTYDDPIIHKVYRFTQVGVVDRATGRVDTEGYTMPPCLARYLMDIEGREPACNTCEHQLTCLGA